MLIFIFSYKFIDTYQQKLPLVISTNGSMCAPNSFINNYLYEAIDVFCYIRSNLKSVAENQWQWVGCPVN